MVVYLDSADAQKPDMITEPWLPKPGFLMLDSLATGDQATVTFGGRWDMLAGRSVASTERLKEKR